MKVTMIVGMPGVGKSTIMKRFMERACGGCWAFQKIPYVSYHLGTRVRVIGRYDEPHPYPGTDRLSMACQPYVLKLLFQFQASGMVDSVFFEGDRLGNDSMIKALQHMGVDLKVVRVISQRDIARPEQTDKFRQSRATKMRNMFGDDGRLARTNLFPIVMPNDYEHDIEYIVDWLIRERM